MNERLTVPELLADDAIAWAFVQWAAGPRGGATLFALSLMQDSRDARLMFDWQRFRLLGLRAPMSVPNVGWLAVDSEPRWNPVGGDLFPGSLDPLPLTWEDILAWGLFILRFGPGDDFPREFQDMGPNADKRDASLMLSLQKARANLIAHGFDHGVLAHNTVIRDIDDRGDYYGGVPLPRLPLEGFP